MPTGSAVAESMTTFQCARRTFRVAVVAAGLLGVLIGPTAHALPPLPVLALAFGVGGTPTPTPMVTPTPTPSPSPPSAADASGPKVYNFPADGSFVSITLPVGWTATADRSGKLLCAPTDSSTGYSATLAMGGSFSGLEQAKSYLNATVRETIASAKVSGARVHPLQTGKLGSGVDCFISVVDGKVGSVPSSYVFMCFAPVAGRYVLFVAQGRADKLSASGFDVVGAMADSIKPL